MSNTLIVLTGPTGVGKTELSVRIASYFNTEIISCDSRQLYREMRIGTAVPSDDILNSIPHHFIQYLRVKEEYNAGMFELDVIAKLNVLFKSYRQVLMTGGSMMYIDAVCKGIDLLPAISPELRKQLLSLYDAEGIEGIRMQLRRLDPDYYEVVDLRNHKRILHALEVCFMAGKPYSSFLTGKKKEQDFDIVKVCLNRDRGELYERINERVDKMVADGLVDEVRLLMPFKGLQALNSVGYREIFSYFEGEISLDEAIEKIKANSRKYARKQLTWLKRDKEYKWFHPNDFNDIISFIEQSCAD